MRHKTYPFYPKVCKLFPISWRQSIMCRVVYLLLGLPLLKCWRNTFKDYGTPTIAKPQTPSFPGFSRLLGVISSKPVSPRRIIFLFLLLLPTYMLCSCLKLQEKKKKSKDTNRVWKFWDCSWFVKILTPATILGQV